MCAVPCHNQSFPELAYGLFRGVYAATDSCDKTRSRTKVHREQSCFWCLEHRFMRKPYVQQNWHGYETYRFDEYQGDITEWGPLERFADPGPQQDLFNGFRSDQSRDVLYPQEIECRTEYYNFRAQVELETRVRARKLEWNKQMRVWRDRQLDGLVPPELERDIYDIEDPKKNDPVIALIDPKDPLAQKNRLNPSETMRCQICRHWLPNVTSKTGPGSLKNENWSRPVRLWCTPAPLADGSPGIPHCFHQHCIRDWFSRIRELRCPICNGTHPGALLLVRKDFPDFFIGASNELNDSQFYPMGTLRPLDVPQDVWDIADGPTRVEIPGTTSTREVDRREWTLNNGPPPFFVAHLRAMYQRHGVQNDPSSGFDPKEIELMEDLFFSRTYGGYADDENSDPPSEDTSDFRADEWSSGGPEEIGSNDIGGYETDSDSDSDDSSSGLDLLNLHLARMSGLGHPPAAPNDEVLAAVTAHNRVPRPTEYDLPRPLRFEHSSDEPEMSSRLMLRGRDSEYFDATDEGDVLYSDDEDGDEDQETVGRTEIA